MAKGSFTFDVDEEDDNLNEALAIAQIDEEKNKAEKKGEKKGDKEPAQKPKKNSKAQAAKDAAVNKKKNEDEADGKVVKKDDLSEPGTLPMADLYGSDVLYSDQLANGDDADDKELEDEDDPRDIIVDDDGFTH